MRIIKPGKLRRAAFITIDGDVGGTETFDELTSILGVPEVARRTLPGPRLLRRHGQGRRFMTMAFDSWGVPSVDFGPGLNLCSGEVDMATFEWSDRGRWLAEDGRPPALRGSWVRLAYNIRAATAAMRVRNLTAEQYRLATSPYAAMSPHCSQAA